MADIVAKDIHGKELYISGSLLDVSEGKVGINTSSPTQLLDVAGTIIVDNARISSGTLIIFDSGASPSATTNATTIYVSGGRLYCKGSAGTDTLLGLS